MATGLLTAGMAQPLTLSLIFVAVSSGVFAHVVSASSTYLASCSRISRLAAFHPARMRLFESSVEHTKPRPITVEHGRHSLGRNAYRPCPPDCTGRFVVNYLDNAKSVGSRARHVHSYAAGEVNRFTKKYLRSREMSPRGITEFAQATRPISHLMKIVFIAF